MDESLPPVLDCRAPFAKLVANRTTKAICWRELRQLLDARAAAIYCTTYRCCCGGATHATLTAPPHTVPKSALQAVLVTGRMMFALHKTRQTPHGDSCFVLANSWSVKTHYTPSRLCGDIIRGSMVIPLRALYDNDYTPPTLEVASTENKPIHWTLSPIRKQIRLKSGS